MQKYQAAVDDFDRQMARLLGVNGTDLRCLEVLIGAREEITPRIIADRLGLTTGSVTTMLDRLERAGYVQRTPHPEDRRKVVVEATDAARRRTWEMIGPLVEESTDAVTRDFTDAELDAVERFLTRATALQERHTSRLRGRD
ncbi:MarR family winged helix-turn-helix transcriptional regulator [Microbacterium sp. OVT16B]|uniref:MarR family winged helix-turn-helix transcriptional regulator n=1 Tax=Microbacterium sp. OVT16B TaxID=2862682 RepID=UPI001CBAE0F9|nr:MarR family transcriptional regulator [Microbacterium sp. OVT16B]